MKSIAVLGSTGSVGTQALAVARERGYRVVGLAAGHNAELLLAQAAEFKPQVVSCAQAVAAEVRTQLPPGTRLVSGPGAADEVAVQKVDTVIAAIPGIAGLRPTESALAAGRHVALANKEAMVVAGPLMRAVAAASHARITPIDSEHSALFQCLLGEPRERVSRLVLTASGGPFLHGPGDLSRVTPEMALKHPNWGMGQKVTIDSATLFNKGLEVLEAHFLFEMPLGRIEVVVHPESLVHGLVRFQDGSLKAQIGPHDMRLPILYGIAGPDRPPLVLEPLPLRGSWNFLEPDLVRFPSLGLAYQAGERGGLAPTYLNAADEVAVEAFVNGRLRFTDIPEVVAEVLSAAPADELTRAAIDGADSEARRLAAESVAKRPGRVAVG